MKRTITAALLFLLCLPVFAASWKGDVNKDGKVDMADMAALSKAINAGTASTDTHDINTSGKVDDNDLRALADIIISGKLTEDSGVNIGIGGWDDSGEDFGGSVGAPPKKAGDGNVSMQARMEYDPASNKYYMNLYLTGDVASRSALFCTFDMGTSFEFDFDGFDKSNVLDGKHSFYGNPVKSGNTTVKFIVFSPTFQPFSGEEVLVARFPFRYYGNRDWPAGVHFINIQTLGTNGEFHEHGESWQDGYWYYIPVERCEIEVREWDVPNPVYVGHRFPLFPIIEPGNATNRNRVFSSDNTDIATVEEGDWGAGWVTALKPGKVRITLKSLDYGGLSDTKEFEILVLPINAIRLPEYEELNIGESRDLWYEIEPWEAGRERLVWTSSDPKIVTVDGNGRITAVSPGEVTITASDSENADMKATCRVKVRPILVEGINITSCRSEMTEGESFKCAIEMWPNDATDKSVTWWSDNTSVATVAADGTVTAVAPGNTTIRVKSNDERGAEAAYDLTVKAKVYPVTGITLNASSAEIFKGSTYQFEANVSPSNATNKEVEWTTSNASVALVDGNGLVTGVGAGSATITATAKDGSGKSAAAKVTVKNIPVSSLTLDATSKELHVGDSFTIVASVLPDDAENKRLAWSSSDPSVATVDVNGFVTAIALGEATITAKTTDGSNLTASCAVKVTPIKVTGIALNSTSVEIFKGATYQLTASVTPSNATDKSIEWTSSNASVATVDANGLVTAVAAGSATITAAAKDGSGVKAKATVNVKNIAVSSLTLDATSKELHVGDSFTLAATVLPENAENKKLTWSSSNASVATVDVNGTVTAIALGDATITAKTTDGSNLSATCAVKVTPIKVTGIALNSTSVEIFKGATYQLTATVTPSNATDKSIEWTSSNSSVATVDANGLVTAVAAGSATITAAAKDGSGVKATATVNVKNIAVSSLTLDATSKELHVGDSFTLAATVLPENAENKKLAWSSSNSSVATVDVNGHVTAIALGEATITAKTTDGSNLTATCAVKVTPINVTGIALNSTNVEIFKGATYQLTATVTPSNATDKSIEWTSSNASVATVDANGLVTALKAGSATITATAKDGSGVKATASVTVKNITGTTLILNMTENEVHVGDSFTLVAIVLPEEAENRKVEWTSSNTKVATVDSNGKVTAIALGEATITAKTTDGSNLTATCAVKVTPIKVTGIALNSTSVEIFKGATYQLTATVTPSNATDKSIEWTSSDTSVAKIDANGLVTAMKAGSATITASAKDGSGIKATASVTVKNIAVSSLTLDATSKELHVGDSFTLAATVLPENAENKKLSWSSSNASVTTVDVNGTVTAMALGDATITAKTTDGSNLTATCAVKVTPIKVTGIALNSTSVEIFKGATYQLNATVTPSNATDKTIEWTTSDASVATVDANGLVTAIAAGSATITATTKDGSGVKATASVTVKNITGTQLTLNMTENEVHVGDSFTLVATVLPEEAENCKVEWTTSNAKVATVDSNGKVTAIALGEAAITAKTTDGSNLTATCAVKVTPIKVTGIALNSTSVEIFKGATYQLTATVTPSSATDKSIEWTSSNVSIATVDANGLLTAVAAGSATITASAKDGSGVKATASVTVKNIAVSSLTLDATSKELHVGDSFTLAATVLPENAENKKLAWSSSNASVATVDVNGHVTAIALGETTITAKTTDGSNLTATCSVKVTPIKVTGIALNSTSVEIFKGATYQLSATVTPTNATDKTIEWTSSNASIATVDANGLVTAVAAGSATITATAKDGSGVKATASVTVKNIAVSSLTLDATSKELHVGDSFTLAATVLPENAENKKLAWSSFNASVATVDVNGTVTAIALGEATITAKTTDGSNLTATCAVKVTPIKVTGIALNSTSVEIFKGATYQLTATVTPSNATDKSIEWTSSNASVATVDANGLVTAVASGSATITATAKDGSGVKATASVTVKNITGTTLILNMAENEIHVGDSFTLVATVLPEEAENRKVEWTSSNTKVATVDSNGKVTAIALGEATITAKTTDGSNLTATCAVKVTPIKVTGIALNSTSVEIFKGATYQLTATVTPSNATDKSIEWTSSNASVATVDANGLVTAVAAGSATITAAAKDGSGVKAKATVNVKNIAVSSLTIDATSKELHVGDSFTLAATVLPENAENKKLAWSSSNASVATVDVNGTVTAIALGEATITAKTTDGSNLTATCSVKVTPIKVTGIALNSTNVEIFKGTTYQLTATVTPSNATDKTIEWTTSDASVATVDANGLVMAVAAGTSTITATAKDGSGIKATASVTVKNITGTTLILNMAENEIHVGDSFTLVATVLPEEAENRKVEWTSSNVKVATVDSNGKVTAIALGEATITAKTTDGSNLTATCAVKVTPIKVTGIALNSTSVEIFKGATYQLTATVTPSNATDKTIEWTTSDASVATVDANGLVTAVAAGSATITASAKDGSGVKATATVNVKNIAVSSLTLDATSKELHVGDSFTLSATVLPENAENKKLAWSSSNASVATVDVNGTVTAIALGEATITAKTTDGSNLTATCAVKVTPILVTDISIELDKTEIEIGESIRLHAEITPWNATCQDVVWISDAEDVASVTADGVVTGIAEGTAVIYAEAADGSGTYGEVMITVIDSSGSVAAIANDAKISIIGNELHISGLNGGTRVTVCQTSGNVVHDAKAEGDTMTVTLPSRGVYLITVGSRTHKIMI